MFSKEIFADRVRSTRLTMALTQQQLGELSGLSKQAINDIENGRRLTTLDKASDLADALCVSLDWLVGRSGPESKSAVKVADLLPLLNQMSETIDILRSRISE